jgi:hypothetical protein
MDLATLVHQYYDAFMARFGKTLLPDQSKALDAILRCRTPAAGELYVQCPDCHHGQWRPLSCGNRHCPRCQNHLTSLWIDKQREKLLPVPYFMATFTLPYQLRSLAYGHQKEVYSLMFRCAAEVLRSFARNAKSLGAEIGMTMVLHTHSRRLEFHPHIHVLIPGGSLDQQARAWKKLPERYLFNGVALAKAFRGKFLAKANARGLQVTGNVPKKWVVHCDHMGTGAPALKYLSRYLYRGVIGEKNIVANTNGEVTFRYRESTTGTVQKRTLKGEEFLRLLLQHVLPNGFRRLREYGFLHGNAKKIRMLVQLILHVVIRPQPPRPRPVFACPHCNKPMRIVRFRNDYRHPG